MKQPEPLWERAEATLTPKQLEVLKLRYLEGMTVADTARAVGVSPQAVQARIAGALRRLLDQQEKAA